jgi:tRNA(Ile)-lysidine synthase
VTTTVHVDAPLAPSPIEAGPYRALIDVDAAPPPWHLRRRHSGDRITPFGLDRDVALRRFMQARRIPRFDRDRVPLVVDRDDRILWVAGGDIANAAALGVASTACVEVSVTVA